MMRRASHQIAAVAVLVCLANFAAAEDLDSLSDVQLAERIREAVWAQEAEAALAKGLKPAALEGVKLDSREFNSDMHADRDYRANLVRVMTKRALNKLK